MKEIAVLECENGKIFRARSHNLDFLNVSVLSDTVVYSAKPNEKIKAYNDVSEALARAYKLRVYDFFFFFFFFFFMSVHLGACPPPPPIPKSWLRYCCQLSLTRKPLIFHLKFHIMLEPVKESQLFVHAAAILEKSNIK